MSTEKRGFQPPDPWGVLTWLLLLLAVLAIILTGEAMSPVPETPAARERAARFAAQERYYEAVGLYGDVEGAEEAARMVYEMEVTAHEDG